MAISPPISAGLARGGGVSRAREQEPWVRVGTAEVGGVGGEAMDRRTKPLEGVREINTPAFLLISALTPCLQQTPSYQKQGGRGLWGDMIWVPASWDQSSTEKGQEWTQDYCDLFYSQLSRHQLGMLGFNSILMLATWS